MPCARSIVSGDHSIACSTVYKPTLIRLLDIFVDVAVAVKKNKS